MKTINITKGVNLRLIDTDKFSYTTISILLRLPISANIATSNSLLAQVLLNGSQKYKNRRLLEIRLEELDGAILDTAVVKKGNEHIIQIYSKFKNEYQYQMLDIIFDILFCPKFNYIDIEKIILKRNIDSQINNKRVYAFNQFLENIYGDVNGDGYVCDVDKIDVEGYYNMVIDRSIVDIMIVGGKEDEILDIIKDSIKFEPRKIAHIPIKKLVPIKKQFIEDSQVVQSKLCVGINCDFECKGQEYARLLVANDIFGTGASSMLYTKAREENSLCYYITSRLLRFSSFMGVEAGISAENMDKTIDIIKCAIDDMNNNIVDKSQIELSKNNIINSYRLIGDKPESLMNFYLNQIIAGDNNSIEDVIEFVKNVDSIDNVFRGFSVDTLYILRGE